MTKKAETATDRTGSVLEKTLSSLERRIAALATKKDNASAAMQVKLARLYLQFASEHRKHEAQGHRITSALSTPLVVQWARGLEKSERAGLVRDLQLIDSTRSGLG
jgi:hypothetical protein